MPKPGPRLRLVDVAERAGVSLATASRALAGRDGVSEEVADRIRAKVDALGGVDHLVLNPLNWDQENLERLASDVLPRLAD